MVKRLYGFTCLAAALVALMPTLTAAQDQTIAGQPISVSHPADPTGPVASPAANDIADIAVPLLGRGMPRPSYGPVPEEVAPVEPASAASVQHNLDLPMNMDHSTHQAPGILMQDGAAK